MQDANGAPPGAPKPAGSGPRALGCLATAGLDLAALLLLMYAGALILRDSAGAVLGILFLYVIGLAQWVYLLPLILVVKRRGHSGMAQGLRLGGLIVLGLNLLGAAAFGIVYLDHQRQGEESARWQKEHRFTHHRVVGTLAAADAEHVEVDTPAGRVSVGLQGPTHYIQLDGPLGRRASTREEIVRVGAAVDIDATSLDGGPLWAQYVSRSLGAAPGSPPAP